MNRKEFINRGLQFGALLTAGLAAGSAQDAQQAPQAPPSPPKPNPLEKFVQQWVCNLMTAMEPLPPAQREQMLESCGRGCARRGAIALAKKHQGDLAAFLTGFEEELGAGNVRRDEDGIFVRYEKCYCPMVGSAAVPVPGSFCHCSRGWLREMFETVTGKPARVEILQTVRRGGPDCRFSVKV